jgi:hypothetical protein
MFSIQRRRVFHTHKRIRAKEERRKHKLSILFEHIHIILMHTHYIEEVIYRVPSGMTSTHLTQD